MLKKIQGASFIGTLDFLWINSARRCLPAASVRFVRREMPCCLATRASRREVFCPFAAAAGILRTDLDSTAPYPRPDPPEGEFSSACLCAWRTSGTCGARHTAADPAPATRPATARAARNNPRRRSRRRFSRAACILPGQAGRAFHPASVHSGRPFHLPEKWQSWRASEGALRLHRWPRRPDAAAA